MPFEDGNFSNGGLTLDDLNPLKFGNRAKMQVEIDFKTQITNKWKSEK